MNHSTDYRTTLQQAARSYLLRTCDQYLIDTDLLKRTCVDHLVNELGAPRPLARTLTDRAWADAFLPPEVVWIGVDWAGTAYPDVRIGRLKHT